jgi:hypothetical protein
MLKGKQIELENDGWATRLWCSYIRGCSFYLFCKRSLRIYGFGIGFFVHLSVGIKYFIGGDTTLLGRLVKAGCFWLCREHL